jgi:hypothetical protein
MQASLHPKVLLLLQLLLLQENIIRDGASPADHRIFAHLRKQGQIIECRVRPVRCPYHGCALALAKSWRHHHRQLLVRINLIAFDGASIVIEIRGKGLQRGGVLHARRVVRVSGLGVDLG